MVQNNGKSSLVFDDVIKIAYPKNKSWNSLPFYCFVSLFAMAVVE
jgi:hypothetical protein